MSSEWKREENMQWTRSILGVLTREYNRKRNLEVCATKQFFSSWVLTHHCLGSTLLWKTVWQSVTLSLWNKFFPWLPSTQSILPTAWNSWENVNFLVHIFSSRRIHSSLEEPYTCHVGYTALTPLQVLEASCHTSGYTDWHTVRTLRRRPHRWRRSIGALQGLQLTVNTYLPKVSMIHFVGRSSNKQHCPVFIFELRCKISSLSSGQITDSGTR